MVSESYYDQKAFCALLMRSELKKTSTQQKSGQRLLHFFLLSNQMNTEAGLLWGDDNIYSCLETTFMEEKLVLSALIGLGEGFKGPLSDSSGRLGGSNGQLGGSNGHLGGSRGQ